MTGREVFEALDPISGLSDGERQRWRWLRSETFETFNRDGELVERLVRGDRLPARFSRGMVAWFAAGWGIDPFQPHRDLVSEVLDESFRHDPCRCGADHRGSVDPRLCDECFLRETVADIRERENRLAWNGRDAAARSLARLSPGRRWLCEVSGLSFGSSGEVFAEAYGEVA